MEQQPKIEKGSSFMDKSKAWLKKQWEDFEDIRGTLIGAGAVITTVLSDIALEKMGIDIKPLVGDPVAIALAGAFLGGTIDAVKLFKKIQDDEPELLNLDMAILLEKELGNIV